MSYRFFRIFLSCALRRRCGGGVGDVAQHFGGEGYEAVADAEAECYLAGRGGAVEKFGDGNVEHFGNLSQCLDGGVVAAGDPAGDGHRRHAEPPCYAGLRNLLLLKYLA